jgi:hypothetical protein
MPDTWNHSLDSGASPQYDRNNGDSGVIDWVLTYAGVIHKPVEMNTADPDTSIYPYSCDVYYDAEVGGIRIHDRLGLIPTEDEFWHLIDLALRWYRRCGEDEVRGYNLEKWKEYQRRFADAHPNATPKAQPVPKAQPKPGYVYVLASAGVYKIGRTVDPTSRQKALGIALPYPVEMVATIYSEDYRRLESDLHEQYAGKRLNGEWFELTADDLAALKALAQ